MKYLSVSALSKSQYVGWLFIFCSWVWWHKTIELAEAFVDRITLEVELFPVLLYSLMLWNLEGLL